MSIGAIASCENHPTREAIGVCVQCRSRVCSECSTKIEGINYCVRCLAGLAQEGGRTPGVRRESSRAAAQAAFAGMLVLLAAGMWLLLQVVLPGG